MTRRLICSLAAVLAIGACSDQQNTAPSDPSNEPSAAVAKASASYVIKFTPAQAGDVRAAVEKAGGKVSNLFSPAGIATAESADPAFASRLGLGKGIKAVAQDTVVQWVDPNERFTVVENAI